MATAPAAPRTTRPGEEVWHLELRGRPGGIDGLAAATYDLLTPLLDVTDAIVAEALALDTPGLGANDRIHVATCRQVDIETIVTADAAFGEVCGLQRIDPRDRLAVQRLLGS